VSSSAKLILVVIVVLVGVTAAYYGFYGPDANKPSAGDAGAGKPTAPGVGASKEKPKNSRESLRSPDSRKPAAPTIPVDRDLTNGTPGGASGLNHIPDANRSSSPPVPVNPTPSDPKPVPPTSIPASSGAPLGTGDPGKGDVEPTNVGDSDASTAPAAAPSSSDVPKPTPAPPGVTPVATQPDTSATKPIAPVLPKPDPSKPPAPPAYTSYTVKAGDTMTSIAEEWFGDPNLWDLISKANPLADPQRLKIGQVLKLPAKDVKRETVDPAPRTGDVIYTVRPGDTLSKIATAYYGDASRWKLIYDVNKVVIGDDESTLKVGMKLTIPPAPAPAKR
jgi:nucleoid-associated protein YgaU